MIATEVFAVKVEVIMRNTAIFGVSFSPRAKLTIPAVKKCMLWSRARSYTSDSRRARFTFRNSACEYLRSHRECRGISRNYELASLHANATFSADREPAARPS